MTTTAHRIYVACLASYNNGTLHGRWIDLEGMDLADLQAEIAEMLRESPYPNVEVADPETGEMVPSAEEWSIHDYDGIPSSFGENPDLENVLDYVACHEEHGEAYDAYVSWRGREYASKEDFEDCYRGEYPTAADYCEEFVSDCYSDALNGLPSFLQYAIDWEVVAREFETGGDVAFIDHGSSVYVFDNH